MREFRIKNTISDDAVKSMLGRLPTDNEYSVLLTGPARVLKPNGDLLCVYVPRAINDATLLASYDVLHSLKVYETTNRGLASGTRRFERYKGSPRTESKSIASAIVGSFDKGASRQYCRLTAFTGRETDKFAALFPMFREISEVFRQYVPERYAVQASQAAVTQADWVVPGTPFTTITVNNSYPTGVHTDRGDLDAGFSNITAIRKGTYTGGRLVFPKFGVAVDLQHGDTILMDAHEHHGNTKMWCQYGGVSHVLDMNCVDGHETERISTVCYYRTKMKECGTLDEEQARRYAAAEADIEDNDAALLKETVES